MGRRYKAVVADFIADALEPEIRVLGDLADVAALDAYDEDELVGRIEDADVVMLYHNLGLSAKTIDRLERCKLIARCGVGYDNVDHELAGRRGIPVSNVPDYGTEEVADSAVGLMLTLARGTAYLNSRLRDGLGPWLYTQAAPIHRLRGRVFAIVGLGRIGSAAALRAKTFGMNVLFYDPYKPDGYDKALGVRRVETLDELLAQAFVLSLHCPLSDETRRIIDGRAIATMPAGSYLINTARGGIVDTAAIPPAIESGQLAGVGIDVLKKEPPPDDHPLVAAWRNPDHPAHHRVVLNPHSAFYCEEGLLEMRTKGARACRHALLGEPIPNVINLVPAPRNPS